MAEEQSALELIKGAVEAETEESEPVEEEEVVAAPAPDDTELEEEDGPSADHPRFKEIYAQMKKQERTNKRLQTEMELLREQNTTLRDDVTRVSAEPEKPEPDAEMEPYEWKRWHEERTNRRFKEYDTELEDMRMATLVNIQRAMHPDYDDMVRLVTAELETNQELKQKIWNNPNPAQAAYEYAVSTHGDQTDTDGLAVEPTTTNTQTRKKKETLDSAEVRMAKRLGISTEDWVKNRTEIAKHRANKEIF